MGVTTIANVNHLSSIFAGLYFWFSEYSSNHPYPLLFFYRSPEHKFGLLQFWYDQGAWIRFQWAHRWKGLLLWRRCGEPCGMLGFFEYHRPRPLLLNRG